MPIPKIIHQLWLGDREPPHAWMETLRTHNPEWEYRLWTDANLPPLRNEATFAELTSTGWKSDLLRFEILSRHGGVYVDADCVCLRPLDDLLAYDLVAAYCNERRLPGLVANGVMGCTPGHPVAEMARDHVVAYPVEAVHEAWTVNGPRLLTQVLFAHTVFAPEVLANSRIYGDKAFYAYNFSDGPRFDFGALDESYIFHAWGSKFGYDPDFVSRIMDLIARRQSASILPPGRQVERWLRRGLLPPALRSVVRRAARRR